VALGVRLLLMMFMKKILWKNYAEYKELDYVLKNSDILTFHMPATEDNYHIINKKTISEMKDNVFIINTSRGSLINTEDLIEGLEKGKISGAALDVIENESGLYYNDLKGQILENRHLAILKSFPNVIVTPHTAFYTDQAVSDEEIKNIFAGKSDKFVVIIGPCSADDEDSVCDYVNRLAQVNEKVKDKLFIVPKDLY